ncbi:MAG TPA: MFS transporter [Nitrososphaerales archaeon]|nr:MFS transporter [Nitrososphaerales archaeon]
MDYKWKALSVTSVGAMMASVDSTVVLLALFPMAAELKSDFVTMTWVVVAYLLVNTALVLSFGRLADMYGRKRMYNIGFVVFTIGSALSGLAFSGISLVGFRVVQGAGAALLTANSFAILTDAFPRSETGKAFGLNSIVWAVGSILGIILGGVIITYTTWRLIFLINIPIGTFGTIWAYRTLRESKTQGTRGSFDIPAALSFTAGLFAVLLGVTWGLVYSWRDPVTLVAFGVSPIFFAFFVVWETKYSKDPIVDFDFFRNGIFSSSIMAAMLQSLAVFSVNFLLIFYLEGISGLSVLNASYLIVPLAIASAVVSPFGGMLADRFGGRVVTAAGLLLQLVVLLLLSRLTIATPVIQIAAIETIYGIGSGFFWPANTSSIMRSSLAGKLGVGSGIMNTFRSTGMILSFALTLTAATAVIPAGIVYQLFIGNLSGKLPVQIGNSYLIGESFAFEISAALLVVALALTLVSVHPPQTQTTYVAGQ